MQLAVDALRMVGSEISDEAVKYTVVVNGDGTLVLTCQVADKFLVELSILPEHWSHRQ